MNQIRFGTAFVLAFLVATHLCATAPAARGQGGATKIVTVTATASQNAAVGKPFDVTVSLAIASTYHIQGNATKEGYVPTVITLGAIPGLKIVKITYPKATEQSIAGDTLPVYEGNVAVKAQMVAAKAGKFRLPITVRYQACDDRACFPPASVTSTALVVVGGKTGASKLSAL